MGVFREEIQSQLFSYSKFPDFETVKSLNSWFFCEKLEIDCLVVGL
jgi:hypothetical protein